MCGQNRYLWRAQLNVQHSLASPRQRERWIKALLAALGTHSLNITTEICSQLQDASTHAVADSMLRDYGTYTHVLLHVEENLWLGL